MVSSMKKTIHMSHMRVQYHHLWSSILRKDGQVYIFTRSLVDDFDENCRKKGPWMALFVFCKNCHGKGKSDDQPSELFFWEQTSTVRKPTWCWGIFVGAILDAVFLRASWAWQCCDLNKGLFVSTSWNLTTAILCDSSGRAKKIRKWFVVIELGMEGWETTKAG